MEARPEVFALYGALFTLAGVLITSIFATINNALNRRSEERKHVKQLVINAAVENWKQMSEMVMKHGGSLYPLDACIFQMLKFHEMVLNKNLQPSEIEQAFKEYDDVVDNIALYKKQRKHSWRDEDA